jgi:aconitate decarboxylase
MDKNDSAISLLCDYILETQYDNLTPANIEDLKNRFIDVVGCAIGGANADGNQALRELVAEMGGAGESTIWVFGGKVPVQNAALINCVMCRSYDFEVTGVGGHSAGTADVTALTLGEYLHCSGKQIMVATAISGDLAVRFKAAQGFDPNHDFEHTGTINGFAATAVAGRLLGLNKIQLRNAFGILVNLLAGSFQSITDGVNCFKLHQGISAKNALFAVSLAKKGFTGIKDPLFSHQGYFPQYCCTIYPEVLTRALGEKFTTRGVHKMVPSCSGNHCTIECGLRIASEADFDSQNIQQIILGSSPEAYEGHLNQPVQADDSLQRALFSLPYAIANVLLRKNVALQHYTEPYVRDPQVFELAQKVKVVELPSTAIFGEAEVRVIMKDGKEYFQHQKYAKGSAAVPVTRDDIKNKFMQNVGFSQTISAVKARKIINKLENLEQVEDVATITRSIVA